MHNHKKERGSYTVEASMIFTTIVLAIILLMFAFSYMQQKAILVSTASFAVQQGAELWLDSRRSMEDGRVNMTKEADSPVYRIFDNLLLSRKTFEGVIEEAENARGKGKYSLKMNIDKSLPGQKALLIGEAICRRLENAAIRPDSTRVRITYSNNLQRGRLTVEIIQEIKVPLGGIKQFLDGKDTLTLSAKSTAAVTEPDEYIRNVDLALELSRKLGRELNLDGILDSLKSKLPK